MSIPVSNIISLIDTIPFLQFLKIVKNLYQFSLFQFWHLSQLARVAQLVERQAFNLNVQGSSPCSGDTIFFLFNLKQNEYSE